MEPVRDPDLQLRVLQTKERIILERLEERRPQVTRTLRLAADADFVTVSL
ncbi:hypothetical protein BBAL3_1059 [Brevundimonas sp. BAL3]|nr:hypothetical protein [Brevundimonas sp. BAL3]EDX79902.1 hypothetical protein BBAL3_1059 [Brevundimonas sp. BAL3]